MLLLFFFSLFLRTCISFRSRSMQNHEFIGPVSQSTQDVDWLGCVELCASRTDCVSYNFKMSASFGGKGLCELIDTKAIDDDCDIETLLVYENGVIFHQLRKANEEAPRKEPFYHSVTKKVFKDCKEALDSGGIQSGVYTINPDNGEEFDVLCDQSTQDGGWIVFQNRFSASVDFYQNWTNYRDGFGSLLTEFWLGFDKLHRLTSMATNTVLLVDMADFKNNSAFAKYDSFKVSCEKEGFALELGNFSGTAGDSLTWHKDMMFSTYDRDHGDCLMGSCAVIYHGAWWYADSYRSNLNGKYYLPHKESPSVMDGIVWSEWNGGDFLKRTEMKIRSVQAEHGVGKN